MNVSGLTSAQLAHIVELEEMEKIFLEGQIIKAPEIIAKALICLAHDYAEFSLEEKAHLLLLKTEEVYPTYTKGRIIKDMDEDFDFKQLVLQLSQHLAIAALSTVRDNK